MNAITENPAPNLAKLSEFDFILAIDASGSMGTTEGNGRSRWANVHETAVAIARTLGKIDSDGLGLVIFGGSNIQSFDGVNAEKIDEVFSHREPMGSTPLAEALQAAIKLAGKSDKKDFIVVFTDGVPNDKAAAAKVIIDQASSQETDDELTILFIQVGNDPQATAYLKSLDDDLTGAKFDIVDAKTQEEAEAFPSIVELIVAAIND